MKYIRNFLFLFCFIALIGVFIYSMQNNKDNEKPVTNSETVENAKRANSNLKTDENKTEINSEIEEENTEFYTYMK